jgi:hypothetical protein
MKKIQIIAIILFLILGITPHVKADSVSFLMYDQPGLQGDGQITFNVFNLDYSGAQTSAVLEYRIDNLAWQEFSSAVITIPGVQHKLTFQLAPNNAPIITTANLLYQGQDGIYYNGANMLWENYGDISSVTMSNKDKISPVPIPAALWLLGTGLLGLLGLRRNINCLG